MLTLVLQEHELSHEDALLSDHFFLKRFLLLFLDQIKELRFLWGELCGRHMAQFEQLLLLPVLVLRFGYYLVFVSFLIANNP